MLHSGGTDRRDAAGGSTLDPATTSPVRVAGILPIIDGKELRDAWDGNRLKPWLRQVIVIADLLCREHGGRIKVTKLLGEGLYSGGAAADVQPLGLPVAGPSSIISDPTAQMRWLATRLNHLYPYGDGDILTALYVPATARIRLRVPPLGYRADSKALSGWQEWGSTPGEIKMPRKVVV